jgi:hypothetical protein
MLGGRRPLPRQRGQVSSPVPRHDWHQRGKWPLGRSCCPWWLSRPHPAHMGQETFRWPRHVLQAPSAGGGDGTDWRPALQRTGWLWYSGLWMESHCCRRSAADAVKATAKEAIGSASTRSTRSSISGSTVISTPQSRCRTVQCCTSLKCFSCQVLGQCGSQSNGAYCHRHITANPGGPAAVWTAPASRLRRVRPVPGATIWDAGARIYAAQYDISREQTAECPMLTRRQHPACCACVRGVVPPRCWSLCRPQPRRDRVAWTA